jgi:hypothetical protein
MVDDGLQDAETAAAVFLGPIDTCPASGRELLEPLDPPVPFALVFREEVEIGVFTFGPVLVEPRAELRAKLFVFACSSAYDPFA